MLIRRVNEMFQLPTVPVDAFTLELGHSRPLLLIRSMEFDAQAISAVSGGQRFGVRRLVAALDFAGVGQIIKLFTINSPHRKRKR